MAARLERPLRPRRQRPTHPADRRTALRPAPGQPHRGAGHSRRPPRASRTGALPPPPDLGRGRQRPAATRSRERRRSARDRRARGARLAGARGRPPPDGVLAAAGRRRASRLHAAVGREPALDHDGCRGRALLGRNHRQDRHVPHGLARQVARHGVRLRDVDELARAAEHDPRRGRPRRPTRRSRMVSRRAPGPARQPVLYEPAGVLRPVGDLPAREPDPVRAGTRRSHGADRMAERPRVRLQPDDGRRRRSHRLLRHAPVASGPDPAVGRARPVRGRRDCAASVARRAARRRCCWTPTRARLQRGAAAPSPGAGVERPAGGRQR